MSTSSSSILPQELVDRIIDEVALTSDDKVTIRICNAVARAFHAQSLKHLFADIEFLVDKRAQRRAGRLRKILESNPALASRVRSFKMIVTDAASVVKAASFLGSHRLGRLSDQSRTVASDICTHVGILKNHFLWVLQSISQAQVQRFTIVGPPTYLNWESLHEYLQAALPTISSNRLHTLEFVNVDNLPAAMIKGTAAIADHDYTSSIRHLNITRSTVRHGDLVQLNTLKFPFLTNLVIGTSSRPHVFDSISQLISRLIKSGRKTVEHLEMRIGDATGVSPDFSLAQMMVLRELKFKAQARSLWDFERKLLFISGVLRSANPDPELKLQVRVITIEFSLTFYIPQDAMLLFHTKFGFWSPLDDSLRARCSNFVALDKVVVHLSLPRDQHDWLGNPPDNFNGENILPRSVEWNRLRVDVTVDYEADYQEEGAR